MKRVHYIICSLLVSLAAVGVTTPVQASEAEAQQLWRAGNSAYAAAEYDMAIDCYKAILEMGYESDVLYYNLGNAYFKRGESNVATDGVTAFCSGELGYAILNYERALKLNPAMEDAQYNLKHANKLLTNVPKPVPQNFVTNIWRSMSGIAGSNTWAVVSLVMFGATLALVLVYLLVGRIGLRKLSFFGAIVTLLIFIVTTAFAITQRSWQLDDSRAIIVYNGEANIHPEPNKSSPKIRSYTQGIAVEVLSGDSEWSEVRFADGEKGWIRTDYIEKI